MHVYVHCWTRFILDRLLNVWQDAPCAARQERHSCCWHREGNVSRTAHGLCRCSAQDQASLSLWLQGALSPVRPTAKIDMRGHHQAKLTAHACTVVMGIVHVMKQAHSNTATNASTGMMEACLLLKMQEAQGVQNIHHLMHMTLYDTCSLPWRHIPHIPLPPPPPPPRT